MNIIDFSLIRALNDYADIQRNHADKRDELMKDWNQRWPQKVKKQVLETLTAKVISYE